MTAPTDLRAEYKIADLPAWKQAEADILLRNMARDLTWWPGLAGVIIQDVRDALKALRETEDVLA
jgi:hypothetical protein